MTADDLPTAPAGAEAGANVRADATAERVIAFLRGEGAADLAHAGSRALLGHLIGTYEILRRWQQPDVLAYAALIHSVYGTDVYDRPLLPLSRRQELISLVGAEAERLAYLFSVTPRAQLFAGTNAWLRDVPPGPGRDAPARRDESDALIVLHMANLAEQARARDGFPGVWLAKLRDLAELVIESDSLALPLFLAELATFGAGDEEHLRDLYRAALAAGQELEGRANRLALAAAACPVVAEPCVWLAHLSRCRGDAAGATWWARSARRRLEKLGTAWDKRLSFGEWLELAGELERPGPSPALETITEPAALWAAWCRRPPLPAVAVNGRPAPVEGAGRERFHRYVDTFEDAGAGPVRGAYPDLESRPWHDAADFPVARYLESHFDEVRQEILALDAGRFQPESERIARTGEWDVAFFYERGRRREEVCEACPVTTRGIETLPAMRTAAGLIYVSRMRPGTHIRPHRGPTNLRLRCHLGITVPDGDCALRVGGETRPWQEGRCLVFDDYLEHEAWNHTARERIVLIVDLWHPGLSATEVRLLEGLHRYATSYGERLHRYWEANAAATVRAADR